MFEILDHPSDAGILAKGLTREEALVEASRGLTSIIVNPDGIAPKEERAFRVRRAARDEKGASEMPVFMRTREIGVPLFLGFNSMTARTGRRGP